MIVHHVAWPFLVRSFQDPGLPDWFRARVQLSFLQDAPPHPLTRATVVLMLVLCGMCVVLGRYIRSHPHAITDTAAPGFTMLLASGGLLVVLMMKDILVGQKLWRSGRAAYAEAVLHTVGSLTGHERLDYEAYRLKRGLREASYGR